MKKVICTILAVLFSITSVMLAFSWLNNSDESANASVFNENALSGKVNIVDPLNVSGTLFSDAVQNKSLFDYETKQAREGYTIVPKTINKANDINSSYEVNSFSLNESESIYLWIFIPNEYFYDLTIKIQSNSSDVVTWSFPSLKITSILEANAKENCTFGWRLFELNVSDAEMEDSVRDNLNSIPFKIFSISYINNRGIFVESNKNQFAFYHIFKAKSYLSRSTVVDAQNYVVYDLKEDYFRGNTYFIDEEFLFTGVKSMFKFLIVGQVNLCEETNNNYTWKITVTDSEGKTFDKAFGEKYIFEHFGYHKIEFILSEYRGANIEAILYLPFTIYVDYFILGSFTNVGYEIDTGETKVITFNISKYFEKTGDIVAYVSDKNKASVAYYMKEGVFYIEVTGIKKGEIKIFVEATGKRVGSDEILTYSCSTAVDIEYVGKSSSEIFLWVILGIYGAGFAIFIAISLVKARKVSVK